MLPLIPMKSLTVWHGHSTRPSLPAGTARKAKENLLRGRWNRLILQEKKNRKFPLRHTLICAKRLPIFAEVGTFFFIHHQFQIGHFITPYQVWMDRQDEAWFRSAYTTSLTTTSSACAFSPFMCATQRSCARSLSGAGYLSIAREVGCT